MPVNQTKQNRTDKKIYVQNDISDHLHERVTWQQYQTYIIFNDNTSTMATSPMQHEVTAISLVFYII